MVGSGSARQAQVVGDVVGLRRVGWVSAMTYHH
jgi:hypothetical protein